MTIVTTIIAFKVASRDCYNLLTAPQTASNSHARVTKVQSCANYVQHDKALITCNMSCATWYEGRAQPLNLTELK